MATINQDPASQASVTLSGISFNNTTATASPFWESIKTATGASVTLSGISFNSITATASPVHTGSRITVEGGSFAANFGTSTIINIETPLTAGAIALLDTPGDNAVSTVALSPAQISATRTDRLVAVDDPLPRALVHAEQGAAQITQATNTDRLVAVSIPVQNALMAGSSDGQVFVVNVVGSIGVGVVPEPPAPTDPDFASVSLLLHMDGSDGSTTFTDSSSNALSVTPSGDAQISTAQSKFGGASALLDGNGDYLLVAADGTAIGTGDFTIECWVRIISGSSYRAIASLVPGADNNSLYIVSNTITWFDNGPRATSATLSLNTWYHVAVTRENSTLRIFVDGVKSNTDYTSTANIGDNTTRIGTRGPANSEWFNGYIDELRITKGISRYNAAFTPPTAPFPDS